MNNLNVIDVSAVVYVGNTSTHFADLNNFGYPVGGLHYLMRQISISIANWDSIVLAFDSPSFRSKKFPDYKSGRVRVPAVYSQLEYAYDALMECGLQCEKYDGYEADDIIEWAVAQNSGKYCETIIVGNDHDLCHSIRPGSRFKSIALGTACVHCGNFTEMADDDGFTLYNTISAKKTLAGCKSDKIPSIELENGMRGARLYNEFVKFIQDNKVPCTFENTTNPNLLRIFAKQSGFFTEADWRLLNERIDLVYPAACPGVEIRPVTREEVNYDKLAKFLTLINDTNSLNCLRLKRAQLTNEDKQIMYQKANSLKSGEYAADKNLEHETLVSSKVVNLDFFEKEF